MSEAARTYGNDEEFAPEVRERLERRALELASNPSHLEKVARIEEAVRKGFYRVETSGR